MTELEKEISDIISYNYNTKGGSDLWPEYAAESIVSHLKDKSTLVSGEGLVISQTGTDTTILKDTSIPIHKRFLGSSTKIFRTKLQNPASVPYLRIPTSNSKGRVVRVSPKMSKVLRINYTNSLEFRVYEDHLYVSVTKRGNITNNDEFPVSSSGNGGYQCNDTEQSLYYALAATDPDFYAENEAKSIRLDALEKPITVGNEAWYKLTLSEYE